MARKTVYNNIVTDEKKAQINPQNTQLLKMYLATMRASGSAKGTLKTYESNINIFFVWLLDNLGNKLFADIKKMDVVLFQDYMLTELNYSPSRIRTVKSSLSSLSNYVMDFMDHEYPNFTNVINVVKSPANNPVRKKTVYEDEELEAILTELVAQDYHQIACCLALAMGSGARKAELPRFKVSFFDKENLLYDGALYETPEKILTKGKGGKMLHKYTLASMFKPYFDKWLEIRKAEGYDSDDLFLSIVGNSVTLATATTLDSWAETINRISKEIGIKKHFYWHSCRHYYTTHLSKAGIPAEVIKQIVGWESVEMVSTYNDMELTDTLSGYFGNGGIQIKKGKSLSEL